MTINDIIDKLDKRAQLTEDEKRHLLESPESLAVLQDIAMVTDALHKETDAPSEEEVDLRLARFHERVSMKRTEQEPQRRAITFPLIAKLTVGAAAAIAAGVFFLKPASNEKKSLQLDIIDGKMQVAQAGAATETASEGILSSATAKESVSMTIDDESYDPQVDLRTIDEDFVTTDTIKLNVPHGNSCKAILPDGSIAYLHPGSKIAYPHNFQGGKRDVYLEGEAYFKIEHDAQHPFTVYTANTQTLVTGTQFDVTATKDGSVSTTLVNGSVQFSVKDSHKKISLRPGQQASYNASGRVSVCNADTTRYVAWRDGYLYFDNSTLGDIMEQICQSYNVTYTYTDARLLNYRMHFFIRRDKDLTYIVEALNKMKKVKVSLRGKSLRIE